MHDDIFARIVIDRILSLRPASFGMPTTLMTPTRIPSMPGVPTCITKLPEWVR